MRINLSSDARPKGVAKSLKKNAEAVGISLNLGTAQHITANIYGYRNWHDMRASMGMMPPSDWDDSVEPAEAKLRKQFQTDVVASALGIDATIAAALISKVLPTRGHSFPDGASLPIGASARSNAPAQTVSHRSEVVVVVNKTRNMRKDPMSNVRVFDLTVSPSKSSKPGSVKDD
ncbi:hypothetical protein [Mesorhizobium sp. INR15]|uniref:hypothetical protein n=1 Tax=Mesorhizobium sp. INR15 TaxID=2654248 RepID=UPI00189648CB|nr:hypothetical protein [Mesorhizobium sp. INR15]QPC91642.1 hypothetical protein GA829_14130 [Mesorhizobium sp. INR15]